ncbi:alpha/beta fold hydrolase [bacterium]|nr:alpha/beta fold hydrolase [bacterium]
MKIKSLGGRGEPLLMIHGWGVNSEIWTSLVDELKLFVTVYVVDLPGMGGSASISPYTLDNMAKEIKANVPIKKCNILGWSLGGQVAMYLAIKMPEFVEKLILMSTTPCFVEKIDWPCGLNKQFFLNFEMEAKKNLNDTLMKFFLIQTRGINDSKKIMRFLKKEFIELRGENKSGMQSALNVLKEADLRNDVKKIDKLTLIITGDKDRLTSTKASVWLYETIKGATLKEIKGANHMPFISHKETMTASVKKFLQNDQ